MKPHFQTPSGDFVLYGGDARDVVPSLPPRSVDMVFADPPYFLSNGGFSVQSGRRVCVDKGAWDRSRGTHADGAFTRQWLRACRECLSDAGTIWVCGTFHNVFSVADALSGLGRWLTRDPIEARSSRPSTTHDPDRCYTFRIRTRRDGEGNLVESYYGKIPLPRSRQPRRTAAVTPVWFMALGAAC